MLASNSEENQKIEIEKVRQNPKLSSFLHFLQNISERTNYSLKINISSLVSKYNIASLKWRNHVSYLRQLPLLQKGQPRRCPHHRLPHPQVAKVSRRAWRTLKSSRGVFQARKASRSSRRQLCPRPCPLAT